VANRRGSAARLAGMLLCLGLAAGGLLGGCGGAGGYTNASLFPSDIATVYLEMFDNRSFRRGVEYTLTDALAKRIEALTPYKIVSDRDRADSIVSGQLVAIGEGLLTIERDTGRAMEKEVLLTAVVNWKNLRTGRLMLNNQNVTATASFSEFQSQDFTYASAVAANKLAMNIVQLMENPW
jgi:hypothetical protein